MTICMESPNLHQLPEGFDLDLAITMAGFAFEAYGEPTGAEDYKDKDANGTETTYFDP